MKYFSIATILNLVIASALASVTDGNPAYDGLNHEGMGALILAKMIDLPLLVTIPIALYCRNVSVAILALIVSNALIAIVLATMSGHGDYIELAVLSQVFIGLLVHRVRAHWRHYPLVELTAQENWFYDKFGITPIDWAWRERVQNLINSTVRKLDVIMGLIVLLSIVSAFCNSSLAGWTVAAIVYVFGWLLFLGYVVMPLIWLESILRFAFSVSKTDRPKTIMDATKRSISQVRNEVQTSELPDKAKSWFKDGFVQPNDN